MRNGGQEMCEQNLGQEGASSIEFLEKLKDDFRKLWAQSQKE